MRFVLVLGLQVSSMHGMLTQCASFSCMQKVINGVGKRQSRRFSA